MSEPTALTDTDAALRREAVVLTRYLLRRDCPAELQERYVRGTQALHDGITAASDRAITRVAFRHPVTLPYLDAAGAVTGRARLLRGKLLLMAAILEASPHFVEDFTPRSAPATRAFVVVAWCVVRSGIEALVGLPLLYLLVARP